MSHEHEAMRASTAAKKPSTALSGEVLDSMPEPSTALTVAANPYLGMIDAVINRGGDIAQVDKLLDLQLKWEGNEARKAFVAAMAAFKAEPMEIFKRKTVEFTTRDGDTTRYKHAELADVTAVVVPAMGKHGLSHRWEVNQAGGQITVTCTITHRDGHSEQVTMQAAPDASGKKNQIQQVASAITYLQRYTLLAATGMSTTSEHDDDGRGYGVGDVANEDPKDADWIRVADQLDDPVEYKAQREKMLKDYAGVNNMPISVRNAFNAAKARVTPKDVE